MVYYEFVERACVQMSFYDNGKQIQLYDNYRHGQMCANPDIPQARAACCRESRYNEVRTASMISGITHLYEGERVTYDKANERCSQLLGVPQDQDSMCQFEAVSISPNNDWFRKGYHWTNKPCGVFVKVNSEGYVAIVHDVGSSYKDTIPYHVEKENSLNWFRVAWSGSEYPGKSTSCAASHCELMEDRRQVALS
jgi:hypothetical protein